MDKKYIEKAKNMIKESYESQEIEQIVSKLQYENEKSELLRKNAREVRENIVGNKIFIRGSLEYSNVCTNDCSFCGMSCMNHELERYTISCQDAKKAIDKLISNNISQLHIVAGEDGNINLDIICKIVKYAVENNIAVTLVLGELDEEKYKKLYEAGARRYILKFETSNQKIFSKYKSNKCLENRIAHLLLLRDIGFKIGTGIIVGLPNTTVIDLAKDILLIKKINPDMASASVFSPNQQSELKNEKGGDINTALNFISLMRIHLLNTQIISCSSSLGSKGQDEAIKAGANLISYHITPSKHANNFSMYKSKDRIKTQYEFILERAQKLGLEVENYV